MDIWNYTVVVPATLSSTTTVYAGGKGMGEMDRFRSALLCLLLCLFSAVCGVLVFATARIWAAGGAPSSDFLSCSNNGPAIVLVCASPQYRHYNGSQHDSTPHAATLGISSVPGQAISHTGTIIAGSRHYSYCISV